MLAVTVSGGAQKVFCPMPTTRAIAPSRIAITEITFRTTSPIRQRSQLFFHKSNESLAPMVPRTDCELPQMHMPGCHRALCASLRAVCSVPWTVISRPISAAMRQSTTPHKARPANRHSPHSPPHPPGNRQSPNLAARRPARLTHPRPPVRIPTAHHRGPQPRQIPKIPPRVVLPLPAGRVGSRARSTHCSKPRTTPVHLMNYPRAKPILPSRSLRYTRSPWDFLAPSASASRWPATTC